MPNRKLSNSTERLPNESNQQRSREIDSKQERSNRDPGEIESKPGEIARCWVWKTVNSPMGLEKKEYQFGMENHTIILKHKMVLRL